MATFTLPPMTVTATVVGGVNVATFPGKPFKRWINEIVVNTAVASTVEVYRDIIAAPARIAINPIGDGNTYNPVSRPVIPPGTQVYVRWPQATSGVSTATITFDGEM